MISCFITSQFRDSLTLARISIECKYTAISACKFRSGEFHLATEMHWELLFGSTPFVVQLSRDKGQSFDNKLYNTQLPLDNKLYNTHVVLSDFDDTLMRIGLICVGRCRRLCCTICVSFMVVKKAQDSSPYLQSYQSFIVRCSSTLGW